MWNLRKLLSESARAKRDRRNTLNIMITILAWLVEFIGGLLIVIGSFIFGHKNSTLTLSLQTLTMLFYFTIYPCTYLINDAKLKRKIADSYWYIALVNRFSCCHSNRVKPNTIENDGELENRNIDNENPTARVPREL